VKSKAQFRKGFVIYFKSWYHTVCYPKH
jgi:hypothetical protein